MKKLFLLFFITSFLACQQNEKMNLLEELIHNEPSLQEVLANADKHEIQILYTQIDRDENNVPHFTSYEYRIDSSQYFYPASTIKMPNAILAMEKINRLSQLEQFKDFTPFTPLRIDSARAPQTPVTKDTTSENGLPSIAHYAKKIFVVSNNDANNRLFEFMGQDYINAQLKTKGFRQIKIVHRLGGEGVPFGVEENKYSNPFTFYDGDKIIYEQPEAFAKLGHPQTINNTIKGKGYMANGELVNEPKDFSTKNFFPLSDMQGILKSVLFPDAVAESERFNLTKVDYENLYKWMGMKPRESRFPNYTKEKDEDGTDHFYDSYVKFFIYGTSKDTIPDHIRIFNKVGWAYGYLTDCSYIVDFEQNIEFLLAATIHVNENQIFNDDNYEYESIGLPFFTNLGKLIYDHEVNRVRPAKPNLSKFYLEFDERK